MTPPAAAPAVLRRGRIRCKHDNAERRSGDGRKDLVTHDVSPDEMEAHASAGPKLDRFAGG
jgi:hypothetical protein